MKKTCIAIIILFVSLHLSAQKIHIGLFGAAAAYNGDLTSKIFPAKLTNGAFGITGNYELSDRIMIRGGYTYSVVGGSDKYGSAFIQKDRNLSFETSIHEFSLLGEYYLFNLYEKKFSPYAFVGLAVFNFNPYTYTLANEKIFLKPLGTEGQGVAGYNRKEYGLTQFAIPFGGGIKLPISNNIRIGLEMGLRQTFTDYLDDVSTSYIDPTDLLTARGPLAVSISYRADEVVGGSQSYPVKGYQRGSPKIKDYYYFGGLHLTFRLGGESGNGFGGGGRKRNRMGCPTNL
jgi:hypothetical protein